METTKQCTKCNILKDFSEFHKHKLKTNGIRSRCKQCELASAKEASRTKIGVMYKIYNSQRGSSRTRGHIKPSYSRLESDTWLSQQPIFHELYDKWVESGYDSLLKPSVDRLDDSIGYSMNNIQLMTWGENKQKGYEDVRSGKNIHGNKPQTPVSQYTIDGKFVSNYPSLMAASRATGISHAAISSCRRGKQKTSGGFIWKHWSCV